jgi:hypothetical protein
VRRVIRPLAVGALGTAGLLAALSGPAFASGTSGISVVDQSGTSGIQPFGTPVVGMLPGMVEERGFEVTNSAATASGPVTAIVTPSTSPLFASGGVTVSAAACTVPWVTASPGLTCSGTEIASQPGSSTASIYVPITSVAAGATVYVDATFTLPASAPDSFESLNGSLTAQVELTSLPPSVTPSVTPTTASPPAPAPQIALPPMQIHSGAPTSPTNTNVAAAVGGAVAALIGAALLASTARSRRARR